MIEWTDSHAHLMHEGVYEDLDALLLRAQEAGLSFILNICTDQVTLDRALTFPCPWIAHAGATTPHDVETEGEAMFPVFSQAAKEGKLAAVGETGLDYYYEHSNRDLQKEFLRRYLHLARECKLPVVIHCREAFDDLFQILDQEYMENGKHLPGVLHCFTGTLDEAREVISRGWYLSLSGIATFKKSEELRRVSAEVPLEQLLIETDTPYLAPQGKRGKPNEPSFLPITGRCIAEVRGITEEDLARATTRNVRTFLGRT